MEQVSEKKHVELNRKQKDLMFHYLTLIAIGTISYVIADIAHEAIGHGGVCLLTGGKIALLTSVYFRSEVHSFITDTFGPLANLVTGLLIWTHLRKVNYSKIYFQLLLLHTMTFNFFWFSWQCLYTGITNKGDFAFDIKGTTELLSWRILLIIIGILSYSSSFYLIVKISQKILNPLKNNISRKQLRQLFLIPYLAAGVSALFAVSFFHPQTFNTFLEAFVFPMFFPMLLIPGYLKNFNQVINEPFLDDQQIKIIISGLIIFVVFCLTMGRGMHF
jgi:hypothetical protein